VQRSFSAREDAMTEIRRVKMKFGDAEFEANVPEDRVQPMYDRFICTLERHRRKFSRPIDSGRSPGSATRSAFGADTTGSLVAPPSSSTTGH
jgi:hypothetical protein